MDTRNLVGSLASALLLALMFVPGGVGSTAALEPAPSLDGPNPCQPILDGSCIHCHPDGVCLSCIVYTDLGLPQVGHVVNHCLHL